MTLARNDDDVARPRRVEPLGYETIARASAGAITVTARMVSASLPRVDAPVAIHLDAEHLQLFDGASGLAITAAQGV